MPQHKCQWAKVGWVVVVFIWSTLLLESWGSTKASPSVPSPSLVKQHKHARRLFKRFSDRYGKVTNINEVQWAKQQDGKVVPVAFHGMEEEEFIMSEKGPSFLRIMCRTMYLFYVFAPAIFTAFLAFFIPSFRNPYWYRMLTRGISYAGAAFIKWGQWSSTRPDIFPEDLCGVMAMLHSDAPVHAYEHTRREVEEALKVPLEQVFDTFDREPIASGSIAQVHVATIKSHKVAVKVRHPGVAEQIDVDFRIMRAVGAMADQIPALKFLNLGHSLEQFSHPGGTQTRLDVEGVHLLLLNENFWGWSDAGFPAPIFLSEAVLIETFEEGCTLSEYIKRYNKWKDGDVDVYGHHFRQFIKDTIAQASQGALAQVRSLLRMEDRSEITDARGGGHPLLSGDKNSHMPSLSWDLANFVVRTGEDVYLKMLLADNLMHCDLHPGNILLHSGDKGEPRLVLVDAGMVARLTDEERETFIGLLEALGEGDGARAAQHVLAFSKTQTCQGEDQENFIKDMVEIFKEKCRGYGTNVSIGDVLRDVLRIVRQYQLRVDVNYATLVINLLCIEGIATALDPTYNLLDRAQPLLWPHSQRAIRPMYKKVFPFLLSMKRRGDRIWYKLTSKVANKPRPQSK